MSKVRLYGATSGYVDLQAPAVAGDVTITLPNASGPFALESYVDDEIAAIPPLAGIGSNVVQAVKTDVFTLASDTYTDVPGLTVTITPSSATSKVLLIGQIALSNARVSIASAAFYRGATALTAYTGVITGSTGNGFHAHAAGNSGNDERLMMHGTGVFLDSPGVTTAVTYTIRIRRWNGGTACVGRANEEPVQASAARLPSSLTAIEVKA